MQFLEKDLETIIYETDNGFLMDRGLNIYGEKKRQIRIGNYGISDLITYERETLLHPKHTRPYVKITVYELKQQKIGLNTFMQGIRYIKGIDRYLSNKRNVSFDYKINLTLIGKEMELTTGFAYLTDLISGSEFTTQGIELEFYTYDYQVDGIKFKSQSGYCLTSEGF